MAFKVGDLVQASRELRSPRTILDEVVHEGAEGRVVAVRDTLISTSFTVEFDNGAVLKGLRQQDLEYREGWGFL